MKNCMLYAADIHINRKIFVCLFSGYQFLIIVAVYITQEIPGRSCPLRHGIGLSLCSRTAYRAGGVNPLINICQRGFSCTSRLVAFHFRKCKRKLIFRHGNIAAVRAVNNRNRLTPVTLSGKYPVTKFEVYCFLTKTSCFDHGRCLFFKNG